MYIKIQKTSGDREKGLEKEKFSRNELSTETWRRGKTTVVARGDSVVVPGLGVSWNVVRTPQHPHNLTVRHWHEDEWHCVQEHRLQNMES